MSEQEIKQCEEDIERQAHDFIEKRKAVEVPLLERLWPRQYLDLVDIRSTHVYDHIAFTCQNPSIDIIQHLIAKFPYNMDLISIEGFLTVPVSGSQNLSIQTLDIPGGCPVPDWIYAIEVSSMKNVQRVSLVHKINGVVFRSDIISDMQEKVAIPMAFSSAKPTKMFYDFRNTESKVSVLPCTPRFDSSGDWKIVLDAINPDVPATAYVNLSVSYINPWNHYHDNIFKKNFCYPKSHSTMIYFMNGKEIQASVHDIDTPYFVQHDIDSTTIIEAGRKLDKMRYEKYKNKCRIM